MRQTMVSVVDFRKRPNAPPLDREQAPPDEPTYRTERDHPPSLAQWVLLRRLRQERGLDLARWRAVLASDGVDSVAQLTRSQMHALLTALCNRPHADSRTLVTDAGLPDRKQRLAVESTPISPGLYRARLIAAGVSGAVGRRATRLALAIRSSFDPSASVILRQRIPHTHPNVVTEELAQRTLLRLALALAVIAPDELRAAAESGIGRVRMDWSRGIGNQCVVRLIPSGAHGEQCVIGPTGVYAMDEPAA